MKIEMGVRIESNNRRLKQLIKKWANHHVKTHEKKKDTSNNIRVYTEENKDDTTMAIYHLDAFTKNWCMNCHETNKTDEPRFRCKECEFSTNDGRCTVKIFANNKYHKYPMDNFGAMS